jgi:hypothetical protein
MKREELKPLKQAWIDATRLKTPAQRRTALEIFLDAPFDVLLKFSKKHRKSVQRRLGPHLVGEGRSYIFAASRRKNVLCDVVHIFAGRSRNRTYAEQILICDHVIVARIPNNCYWVRELVRAAAGSFGGARIVNVDEYIGGCYPDFHDDVKHDLPRLKSYRFRGSVIPCAWSTRDLGLQSWLQRIREASGDELAAALKELDEKIRSVNVAEDVQTNCQARLNPLISPHLLSPHQATQLWANRVWAVLNHGA